jgi:hypothetical protein
LRIATNAYKRLNAKTAVLLYENTNAGIGTQRCSGKRSSRSAEKFSATLASAAM